MNYVLVFIGGGLGSTLRHMVNVVCSRILGTAFPYHTFIINITGSTVMGLIAGYLAFRGDASQPWRLFLMTHILGVLARCSAALRAGRDRACTVLRAGIGGIFDCGPVRRPRAGSPPGVNPSLLGNPAWASIMHAWVLSLFHLLRCAGETKQVQPHHAPDRVPCQNCL